MPRLVIIDDKNPDWGYIAQRDPLCSVECDIDRKSYFRTRERLKQRLLGWLSTIRLQHADENPTRLDAEKHWIFRKSRSESDMEFVGELLKAT